MQHDTDSHQDDRPVFPYILGCVAICVAGLFLLSGLRFELTLGVLAMAVSGWTYFYWPSLRESKPTFNDEAQKDWRSPIDGHVNSNGLPVGPGGTDASGNARGTVGNLHDR